MSDESEFHSSDEEISNESERVEEVEYIDRHYIDKTYIPINHDFDRELNELEEYNDWNPVESNESKPFAHLIFDPINPDGNFLDSIENDEIVNAHIQYNIAYGGAQKLN